MRTLDESRIRDMLSSISASGGCARADIEELLRVLPASSAEIEEYIDAANTFIAADRTYETYEDRAMRRKRALAGSVDVRDLDTLMEMADTPTVDGDPEAMYKAIRESASEELANAIDQFHTAVLSCGRAKAMAATSWRRAEAIRLGILASVRHDLEEGEGTRLGN